MTLESTNEDPPGAGVLPLLIHRVVVGVFIDFWCEVDVAEVTCLVKSSTPELMSEDEAVVF